MINILQDINILKSTEHIINLANNLAQKMDHPAVGTEHALLAFMVYRGESKQILRIKNLLMKYSLNDSDFIKTLRKIDENFNAGVLYN